MPESILQTKLFIPPLHKDLVHRSRLTETIQRGINSGAALTLIAAPAGFGKSTAISVWADQAERPTAWLSLDEADNEIFRFWLYLVSSLRLVQPGLAEGVFSTLEEAAPSPISVLLPALLNDLSALPSPITLVLDDYHVIDNPEIHESLQFLLDHQPPQLHLLISTRADPPLALGRLRAARRLTEIRSEELRFTDAEGRMLLNEVMGLDLNEEQLKLLEKRTEGWGVGLLLAAQSLQGRSDREVFIRSFSGSQNYVLEYLTEEVLNQQTRETRSFLLKTSLLDRFNASLCDAVIGTAGSQNLIQQLDNENLFLIPLDTRGEWYRYHHLFGDLLRLFLNREYSEVEIQSLHRSASDWFQKAKEIETAVDHALRGADFQSAADLIDRIVDQVISRGHVKTLLKWLGEIPEDVITSRPRLLMHQGWAVFLSGKVSAASVILQKGKASLANLPEGKERELLQGRLSAMLATLTALTRDLERAIKEAQEAVRFLPESEVIYLARANRAWGVSLLFQGDLESALAKLEEARQQALKGGNLFLASEITSQMATVHKHRGDLAGAEGAYLEILRYYPQPETSPPACLGYIGLAEVALDRNRLEEATQYLNLGIELSRKGSIGYALQPALLIQGVLNCLQGDRTAAREAIQSGEKLSRTGGGSLESILGLAYFQTRLNMQCGDLEKAHDWASGAVLPPGWSFQELPPLLEEFQQSILARVHLLRGEYPEVLEVADRICSAAEQGGRLARVAELRLYQAAALQGLSRSSEALDPFRISLELGEKSGNLRLFLDVGVLVRDLLQIVSPPDSQGEFTARLVEEVSGRKLKSSSPAQAGLIEPLTDREWQVLELMGQGCSNQAIADQLVVSVNTVKKHTSNIYAKLEVRNRAQAMLKAGNLGLLGGKMGNNQLD